MTAVLPFIYDLIYLHLVTSLGLMVEVDCKPLDSPFRRYVVINGIHRLLHVHGIVGVGILVDVRICHQMLHHEYRFLVLRHHDLVCGSLYDIVCAYGPVFHKFRVTHNPACLEIEDKPGRSSLHPFLAFIICDDEVSEEE